mmetsp:Transcript_13277/g.29982  ORF Transcript_13277/g.29982 Transcript_13277/m.29982 type:complete len:362 (-) Transcript_13277:59-1144(-)
MLRNLLLQAIRRLLKQPRARAKPLAHLRELLLPLRHLQPRRLVRIATRLRRRAHHRYDPPLRPSPRSIRLEARRDQVPQCGHLRLEERLLLLERRVLSGERRDAAAQLRRLALGGGDCLLQLLLLLLEEKQPLLVGGHLLLELANLASPLLLRRLLARADLVGDDLEGHRRREQVGARLLEHRLVLGAVCLVELPQDGEQHALVVALVGADAVHQPQVVLPLELERRVGRAEEELRRVEAHGEAREEGLPQVVLRDVGGHAPLRLARHREGDLRSDEDVEEAVLRGRARRGLRRRGGRGGPCLVAMRGRGGARLALPLGLHVRKAARRREAGRGRSLSGGGQVWSLSSEEGERDGRGVERR